MTSLNANPAWSTNVANLEHDIPASIAILVEEDPQSFVELLATETAQPAYLSAVPTGVIQTLTSLASEPLHAVSDIKLYVESLRQNGNTAAISLLATDIPKSVQDAAIADPIGFLATLVAASTNPSWLLALQSSVQGQVASAVNHALSIVASDVPRTTIVHNVTIAMATTAAASGPVLATAIAMPKSGIMSTSPATGSPIVFRGGATWSRAAGSTYALTSSIFLGLCLAL